MQYTLKGFKTRLGKHLDYSPAMETSLATAAPALWLYLFHPEKLHVLK